ncbi:MAG: carbohydrate kinase family protein [Herpetosiphonaceae bacterium]|nr:carbohydrate kinase family protein [Herpetosiphonaceae bacterium]
MPQHPQIVVIGGASLDIKGRLRRDFLPGTSNAASVQISVGGVARNIAENLVRLGLSTALICAVCGDDFGRSILSQTEAAGVDMGAVMLTCDQRSAAYIALLSPDGTMLAGLDDSQTARLISPDWIDQHASLLTRAAMVVIDANTSRQTADHIVALCDRAKVPVAFDAVAVGLADRYRERVGNFTFVTGSELEAEVLAGMSISDVASATAAAQHLITQGTKLAVIALGQGGVVYATPDEVGHVPPIEAEIVDPTGAGEALAAMIIYGLVNDIPVAECVRLGVVAASLTSSSPETVAPDLSLEQVYATLET